MVNLPLLSYSTVYYWHSITIGTPFLIGILIFIPPGVPRLSPSVGYVNTTGFLTADLDVLGSLSPKKRLTELATLRSLVVSFKQRSTDN